MPRGICTTRSTIIARGTSFKIPSVILMPIMAIYNLHISHFWVYCLLEHPFYWKRECLLAHVLYTKYLLLAIIFWWPISLITKWEELSGTVFHVLPHYIPGPHSSLQVFQHAGNTSLHESMACAMIATC